MQFHNGEFYEFYSVQRRDGGCVEDKTTLFVVWLQMQWFTWWFGQEHHLIEKVHVRRLKHEGETKNSWGTELRLHI